MTSALPLLTATPLDEPTLNLKVNGKNVSFLGDTGATHLTIRKDVMPTAPLSLQRVNVVGISGIAKKIPRTQNLTVEYGPFEVHHAFLLAANSPVNLLGRDLLCRLGCTVRCSPDGVYLDIPEIEEAETLETPSRSIGPVVYWWRV